MFFEPKVTRMTERNQQINNDNNLNSTYVNVMIHYYYGLDAKRIFVSINQKKNLILKKWTALWCVWQDTYSQEQALSATFFI